MPQSEIEHSLFINHSKKFALDIIQDWQGWLLVLLFASPIALWLISLAFAVRVFSPETYKTNLQSPDLARDMLQEIVAYKHRQLKHAHKALLPGFVLLVVNIIVYLGWIPQVAPK